MAPAASLPYQAEVTDAYRHFRRGPVYFEAARALPEEWVRAQWDRSGATDAPDHSSQPLPEPAGGEAIVKRVRSRDRHSLLRRLRAGRARREGTGYRAFAAAGLATPHLLFWAEERRYGLHVRGLVATKRFDAKTVADAYGAQPDPSLLAATAQALARIHAAGLAHGDPRLRNFFATQPDPLPFDLASWSALTRATRDEDLTRLLGSSRVAAGDEADLAALLRAYRGALPGVRLDEPALRARAEGWAETKRRP